MKIVFFLCLYCFVSLFVCVILFFSKKLKKLPTSTSMCFIFERIQKKLNETEIASKEHGGSCTNYTVLKIKNKEHHKSNSNGKCIRQ
jgi:hypothetical protein